MLFPVKISPMFRNTKTWNESAGQFIGRGSLWKFPLRNLNFFRRDDTIPPVHEERRLDGGFASVARSVRACSSEDRATAS